MIDRTIHAVILRALAFPPGRRALPKAAAEERKRMGGVWRRTELHRSVARLVTTDHCQAPKIAGSASGSASGMSAWRRRALWSTARRPSRPRTSSTSATAMTQDTDSTCFPRSSSTAITAKMTSTGA